MSTKILKNTTSKILLLLLICAGCGPRLPKQPLEKTKQVDISYEKVDSKLNISLTNLLECPVRISMHASTDLPWKTVQLKPRQDTVLISSWNEIVPQITFGAAFGDPSLPVKDTPIQIPVSRHRNVKIIQGYNGSFTHNHNFSRYAVDFALPVGDTLYATSSGYVVEVVEGYRYGGNNEKWIKFGNRILLYDPESNRFFLYSHLKQNGSFVEEGDYMEAGQPLGLSGNTGYTTTPHLHFAVLTTDEGSSDLTSRAFNFVEGYDGEQFTKNSILPKK